MSAQKQELFGHPRGLTLLFFTEMWERFSYYGMRAIFTLYMMNALFFSREKASEIYGSYTGLVYLTPLIGGYVADRYWGNQKSIIAGGILMAIGQFFMFGSASMYENVDMATALLWGGLVFLIIGNGFFKPNISSMIGQMYTEKDKRRDAAYTIFYMGINLGAFLAPLVCGFLGNRYAADGVTALPEYFKWGFLAAGIGMILGTLLFWFEKNRYVVDPEGNPIGVLPNQAVESKSESGSEGGGGLDTRQLLMGLGLSVGLFLLFWQVLGFDVIGAIIYGMTIAMMTMIITDKSLTKIERDRIIVIYVSAFFVVFFWAAFEQAGVSLTFFAEEQTIRQIGMSIPMWLVHTVSLGLLAVMYWAFNIIRSNFAKLDGLSLLLYVFILGPALFILYQNIVFLSNGQASISMDTIPASYFQSINAVAIVILAPITAAIWMALAKRKSEPNSLVKQAIGLVILALGYAVIALGVQGLGLSGKVSMFWLVGLYVIHTIGELCLSPIGLSLVSKLSPIRFVSLLFGVWFLSNAVANKAAGQLSALYPPIAREFKMAADNGFDEDTYRGILEGNIIATEEQKTIAQDKKIPLEYPNFFGPVKDLYRFFMIFVIMAGIAGLILFLLSFPLRRMMHGAD